MRSGGDGEGLGTVKASWRGDLGWSVHQSELAHLPRALPASEGALLAVEHPPHRHRGPSGDPRVVAEGLRAQRKACCAPLVHAPLVNFWCLRVFTGGPPQVVDPTRLVVQLVGSFLRRQTTTLWQQSLLLERADRGAQGWLVRSDVYRSVTAGTCSGVLWAEK